MEDAVVRWAAALSLVFAASGCGYTVQMSSQPLGAYVELPNGETVITPQTVTLKVAPFGKQVVRVSAPGYRTLEVDLRKGEVTLPRYFGDVLFHPGAVLGYETRGEIVFVMVADHGPVGTWSEEEE